MTAEPLGGKAFAPASITVRSDARIIAVVVELVDEDGAGIELRISPHQALEAALRIAASVAKLMRIEQ
jgi:hypothetical protein